MFIQSTYYLIVGILLIFLINYLWKQKSYYLLYWKFKGPLGLPFIGIALKLRNKETFLNVIENFVKIYNSPFVSWLGPKCILYCTDPDTIETLLKSPKCVNKNSAYEYLHDLIGNGLFTTNGSNWYSRSKLMKPAFKRKTLSNFYSIFNNESKNFMKKFEIDENLQNGSNMFNFMQLMTLKVTYQTTLGSDSKDAEVNFNAVLQPFKILTQCMIDRIYQPLYHNRTIYQLTPHWNNALKTREGLNILIDKEIAKKDIEMKTYNQDLKFDDSGIEATTLNFSKPPPFKENSFLEYVLHRKDNNNMSLKDIRCEIETLISGGFETTAVVMYTTIICLAMFPEEQEKLFENLILQFPNKDFDINQDDFKKLTYIEMCINEAMRVIAPVPVVGRIATDDIELNNGTIIPKGTELIIDVFTMQRSTKYWGENAKIFNPENFQPGNYKNKHPYAFIPFTKGFRYAYILMKIFLTKFFRNYKITTDMKFEDLVFVNSISIKYKIHPTFKIEKREY